MKIETSFVVVISHRELRHVSVHIWQSGEWCGSTTLLIRPTDRHVPSLESIPLELPNLSVEWGCKTRVFDTDVDEEDEGYDVTSEPWAQQLIDELTAWSSGDSAALLEGASKCSK